MDEFRGLVYRELKEVGTPEAGRRLADVVVIGTGVSAADTSRTVAAVRHHNPKAKILVIAAQRDKQYWARAIHVEGLGCVFDDATRTELIKAFRSVLAGKQYTSESMRGDVSRHVARGRLPLKALSKREEVVLRGLAAGKRSCEIASELNLSFKTIGTFKRRILVKLGLRTTADLIRYADDGVHRATRV